jgi:nitrite reductase (NADH) small subunit
MVTGERQTIRIGAADPAVMSEIKLGPVENIPPGEGRVYDADGDRIAVFRARGGEVYAVQAECPHRGGPLADGLLGGSTLICPLHGWKFDLKTGQAVYGDCGLKTYSVSVDASNQLILIR